jgi:hypothetical protein
MTFRSRAALSAAAVLSLALAACSTSITPQPQVAAPAAPPPILPSKIPARDLVGRWGFAAYHKEGDRARIETAARGQCGQPYVISAGPTGGVMMHLADQAQPQELRLKGSPQGRDYVGPGEDPAGDVRDREIVSFDGRILVLRWMDPEIAGRYGTGIYVRCAARG